MGPSILKMPWLSSIPEPPEENRYSKVGLEMAFGGVKEKRFNERDQVFEFDFGDRVIRMPAIETMRLSVDDLIKVVRRYRTEAADRAAGRVWDDYNQAWRDAQEIAAEKQSIAERARRAEEEYRESVRRGWPIPKPEPKPEPAKEAKAPDQFPELDL